MKKQAPVQPDRTAEVRRLISDINYDILKMRQDLQALRTQYERMQAEMQRLKQEISTCRR